MTAAEAGGASELQDGLNRFVYHPLARRLAWALLPTRVSPNAVSVAGTLLIWAAAWAYVTMRWPQGALLGFLLHAGWHVLDGADGTLARLRHMSSPTGELVDGVCDYAGHVPLYFAFGFLLDDSLGGWAWVLAVAAGASHIAQTNHAESQRRNYLWRAYGVPWLVHAQAGGDEVFAQRSWFSRGFGWMARDYLRLANKMVPAGGPIDAALTEAAGDPERLRRIRHLARRMSRPSLRFQKALGSNPKTLLIGASMALGSPLWFFLAEILLLNLLLLWSVRHHNTVSRRLAAALTRQRGP
ncbi:MAG TPA: CDP-alcohol phosphatidyltransferase family protein [Allosphingosinicella sp.]|nr:CDP-alcohol phosphatidyltransferase family protein [Allosphingosinicella sp.]